MRVPERRVSFGRSTMNKMLAASVPAGAVMVAESTAPPPGARRRAASASRH
jgi:hypothetical protein